MNNGRIIFQGDWVKVNGVWLEVVDITGPRTILLNDDTLIDTESTKITAQLSAPEYFEQIGEVA